jgi:diamine N-acetyltransferase
MASEQEQPILNVVGDKVALGPLRRDLLPLYTKWFNDFEVTRTLLRGWRPMTAEAEERWYERASAAEEGMNFTIWERATLRPIGNTGLMEVSHVDRTAEFGIVIGEKDCWGKGYGTEATMLMLDYGFSALNLHNVLLRVYAFNQRGIRAYARAGFREIGRRREAFRRGGRVEDVVYMDCLATEFKSPVLRKVMDDSGG